MTTLQTMLLSNALLVLPLAVVTWLLTRFVRQPSLVWALWGLVLLKFVTPAVVPLPVDSLLTREDGRDRSTGFQLVRQEDFAGTHGLETGATATLPQLQTVPDAPTMESWDVDAVTADVVATEEALSPLLPTFFDPPDSVVASSRVLEPAPTARVAPIGYSAGASPTPHERVDVVAASLSFVSNGSRWFWGAWLGGSLIATTIAVWRSMRFRRLLDEAAPADACIINLAQEIAAELRLRRLPEIRICLGRVPPLLWAGLVRPTILLPRELFETLDAEGRRALLAHELTHVTRHDHWTRWLELAVRCLYWWHPVAWWAGSRLREAEEECCDARVVALAPGSAKAYARAVMATVDFLAADSNPAPALATGLHPLRRSVRPLQRRLTMICHAPPAPRFRWLSRFAVVAIAAVVLPLSVLAHMDEGLSTEDSGKPSADASGADDSRRQSAGLAADSASTELTGATGADEPASDAERARHAKELLSQARKAISQGRLDQALSLALGAQELNAAYGLFDDRPEHVLAEVARQTGNRDGSKSGQPGAGGIGRASGLQPVDQTRPEVLTAPEDYEEITVVAEEYELPANIAQALQQFLGSVEGGFPVLVTSLKSGPSFSDAPGMFGTSLPRGYGGYGGGTSDDMILAGSARLRVVAPEAVQEALGGFVKSMQQISDKTTDAKTITLVRAEYALPAPAVESFAALVKAYQESGLATPLVVKTSGSRLSLTARKEVHENIRKFILFLGEHWKTASLTGKAPQPQRETFVEDQGPGTPQAASREFLEMELQIAKREVELAEEKVAFTIRLIEKGYKTQADLKSAEVELLKAQRTVKQLESKIDADRSENRPQGVPDVPQEPADPNERAPSRESSSVDGLDSLGVTFSVPIGLRSEQARLRNLQLQKRGLREEHGPDHPDVKKLQQQIEALESQLKSQFDWINDYGVPLNPTPGAADEADPPSPPR